MVAIPFLLFDAHLGEWLDARWWGNVLIHVAAFLTVWSMLFYLNKAIPHIRERSR
jgi:CDP-diacylglycerol--glycerol-3-phosphate 3-phosphatidyltransferase